MSDLTAQHYLNIYRVRQRMQNGGVTNPSAAIRKLTNDIVEKLSALPADEPIILNGWLMLDSRGTIIAAFPDME